MTERRLATVRWTPAQRAFLRRLSYEHERPIQAIVDDALLLLEAAVADSSQGDYGFDSFGNTLATVCQHYWKEQSTDDHD